MRGMGRAWRTLLVAALAGGPLVLAGSANAGMTGPCDGSATIKGVTYTPANDTPANPVVLPDEEGVVVKWEGHTTTPIHNHNGAIGVHIGPLRIDFADWAGKNAKDETREEGNYQLDDFYDAMPFKLVGIYRVSGDHQGDEGSCEGFAMVKIEGSPLGTIPGVVGLGLTVLFGAVTLVAGVGKGAKP